MKTAIHILTFGVLAAGAIPNKRFVGYDGNLCGVGVEALGVSHAGGADAGEQCPLAQGIEVVETGGAVTAEDEVQSDAQGRAVPKTTGVRNGKSLDTATGAGEFIRVKTF